MGHVRQNFILWSSLHILLVAGVDYVPPTSKKRLSPEFLKWAHLSQNSDTLLQIGFQSKVNNRNANPDETAHYEPSHLDLHCLQMYPCWSAGMKGLKRFYFGNTHWNLILILLSLKALSKLVADNILNLLLLFFREDKDLTFHVNHLLGR